MNKLEPFKILIVEDNEDDILVIKRCFKQVRGNKVNFVRDGEQALEYIFGEGQYEDREERGIRRRGLSCLILICPRLTGLGS